MNRIAWLERNIEEAGALLAQDEARLRETPDDFGLTMSVSSARAHLNDLQHQLHLARADRAREVVGMRLRGDRLRHGSIPLRLLTKVGEALGGALAALAWRAQHGTEATRMPPDFIDSLDLRLADLMHGSTRLVFTGNTMPDLLGDSPVETGLRTVFELLQSDTTTVALRASEAGTKATRKVSDLLYQFERERCGVELTWTDSREQQHQWKADTHQVATLYSSLAELTSQPPQEIILHGEVELLSKTGRVGIRTLDDESRKLSVRYPRDLYAGVQELHLGQQVQMRLLLNRVYNPNTQQEASTYTLLELVGSHG